MVKFDAKINDKDMYQFNMHHAYTSSQGIISIVAAVIGIGASVATYGSVDLFYTVAYFLVGLAFLVYLPITLKLRSKAQIAGSPVLQGVLHYELNDTGVVVTVDQVEEGADNSATLPWKSVYKCMTTKDSLLIYSSRINAYIIPKREIEDQYAEIKAELEGHLEKHRLSLKW